MPLLMIDPAPRRFRPKATSWWPAAAAAGIRVAAGQLLAIRDIEGGQPAALFALTAASPSLFLSPHHTRVFSNSFMLRLGMRLVTNKRRPVMVLGVSRRAPPPRPADAAHRSLGRTARPAAPTGCATRSVAAYRSARRQPAPKIADPVNLFLDVAVPRRRPPRAARRVLARRRRRRLPRRRRPRRGRRRAARRSAPLGAARRPGRSRSASATNSSDLEDWSSALKEMPT